MNNKQGYEIPWWAIVLGFIFWWPAGMVLLFLNLGGVRIPIDKGSAPRQGHTTSTGYRYNYTYSASSQAQPRSGVGTGSAGQTQPGAGIPTPPPRQAADPGRVQQGQRPQKREWGKKIKDGKAMTILGGLMSFIFGIGFVPVFADALRYGLLLYADEWFPLLGFLCASLFLFFTGLGKTRLSRRQRLYLGVIGQKKSVFLSDLAGAAGVSEKRVISDIQKMLSDGILPMGYIDRASGRLVLTDQGYEAAPEPPKREEPPKTAAQEQKQKEEEDYAILRQIKAVNDAIPGEEMSRKIDRIGEITKKILDYQRQNPAKAGELRQFLNYYLPTTLKLLKTYAQLESQGVEGENITASKQRIEGMMDKVVEGFEKQLDQLFQTDAMDIATDVEVLERMLEKDGLGSGMTMGG